jgi:hypothetical protein
MLRRVIIAIACVAVLGAVSIGVAAAAPGKGSGTLKGRTGQGRQIRLRMHGKSIQIVRFTAQLRCRNGEALVDEESGFQPTAVKGGRFRDDQVGSTDEVLIRGHLRGNRAAGSIRVEDRLGKVRCDSRWVGFKAH